MLLSTGGFCVDNAPDGRWCEVIAPLERGARRHPPAHVHAGRVVRSADGARRGPLADLPGGLARRLGARRARLGHGADRPGPPHPAPPRRRDRPGGFGGARPAPAPASTRRLSTSAYRWSTPSAHWSTSARPGSGAVDFQQAAKMLTFHRAELHLDEAIGAALRALTRQRSRRRSSTSSSRDRWRRDAAGPLRRGRPAARPAHPAAGGRRQPALPVSAGPGPRLCRRPAGWRARAGRL